MASTAVSSTNKVKQATNNGTTNGTPITEEELKQKETPITVDDIFRLQKSTDGMNAKKRSNTFVHRTSYL